MYMRFVEGGESSDARWLTGVITAARVLRDEGRLDPYQVEIVESIFNWFNDHVPCPPFGANRSTGNWSEDAVAWFAPTATEAIKKMWELVAVLEQQNIPVRVVRSESPGLIVYRDEYQVVAETPKRGGRHN